MERGIVLLTQEPLNEANDHFENDLSTNGEWKHQDESIEPPYYLAG